MITHLIYLFVTSLFISLATFGGGSQALFYQFGVLQTHWISSNDLAAIVAFGYATPGPAVLSTATFIGYRLDGFVGAFVGTVGIFLVPFVLALLAARYLSKLLQNPRTEYFVKGVGLAAAGVVASTAVSLMHVSQMPIWQFGIVGAALYLSLRTKVHPVLILLGGAILGFVL